MIEVLIKPITYTSDEDTQIYYHAFMKEEGKVTAFSVMTNEKGK